MSTRQERRRAERAAKKEGKSYEMQYELIQPWSTFVLKTKLPQPIFDKMIKITDTIVDNVENEESFGHRLVGQIKDELESIPKWTLNDSRFSSSILRLG